MIKRAAHQIQMRTNTAQNQNEEEPSLLIYQSDGWIKSKNSREVIMRERERKGEIEEP